MFAVESGLHLVRNLFHQAAAGIIAQYGKQGVIVDNPRKEYPHRLSEIKCLLHIRCESNMAPDSYDWIDHFFRALHNVGNQEKLHGVQEHLHQELRNKYLNHDRDQIPWIKAYQCRELISGKDFPVGEQKCNSSYKI